MTPPAAAARIAVEPWDPAYAAPVALGDTLADDTSGTVDVNREEPAAAWRPRRPSGGPAGEVVFVDGVRRIDARLWVTGEGGTAAGVAASYAAGAVRCDGAARVEGCLVRRGLFSPADTVTVPVAGADYRPCGVAGDDPESLTAAVQERMRDLELEVLAAVDPAELVVVDGPLRGRRAGGATIGYVKTHRVRYLPALVEDVVAALEPGERTPLFLTQTSWSRWSWYLRLPLPVGAAHPWAAVVRAEADPDLPVAEAAALADRATTTLVGFASEAHKDPRAPQNLYPIAGLERHLRRLLGDPRFLYRQLAAALRA